MFVTKWCKNLQNSSEEMMHMFLKKRRTQALGAMKDVVNVLMDNVGSMEGCIIVKLEKKTIILPQV